MKISTTYQQLLDLDRDVKYQMQVSPAFLAFHREKIKRFMQENKVRLKILADTFNNLMELHIKKNDKGGFLQRVKPEGEPNSWDFKSDEDEDTFKKEVDLFLSKSIEMIL